MKWLQLMAWFKAKSVGHQLFRRPYFTTKSKEQGKCDLFQTSLPSNYPRYTFRRDPSAQKHSAQCDLFSLPVVSGEAGHSESRKNTWGFHAGGLWSFSH